MSDSSIMSIRDLIDSAFGEQYVNPVNFRTIRTVLYLLARQLHVLERRVEVNLGFEIPMMESDTVISITELKISAGVKKPKKMAAPKKKGAGAGAMFGAEPAGVSRGLGPAAMAKAIALSKAKGPTAQMEKGAKVSVMDDSMKGKDKRDKPPTGTAIEDIEGGTPSDRDRTGRERYGEDVSPEADRDVKGRPGGEIGREEYDEDTRSGRGGRKEYGSPTRTEGREGYEKGKPSKSVKGYADDRPGEKEAREDYDEGRRYKKTGREGKDRYDEGRPSEKPRKEGRSGERDGKADDQAGREDYDGGRPGQREERGRYDEDRPSDRGTREGYDERRPDKKTMKDYDERGPGEKEGGERYDERRPGERPDRERYDKGREERDGFDEGRPSDKDDRKRYDEGRTDRGPEREGYDDGGAGRDRYDKDEPGKRKDREGYDERRGKPGEKEGGVGVDDGMPGEREERGQYEESRKRPDGQEERGQYEESRRRPDEREERGQYDESRRRPDEREEREQYDESRRRPDEQEERGQYDESRRRPDERDTREGYKEARGRPGEREDYDESRGKPGERDKYEKDGGRPGGKSGRAEYADDARSDKGGYDEGKPGDKDARKQKKAEKDGKGYDEAKAGERVGEEGQEPSGKGGKRRKDEKTSKKAKEDRAATPPDKKVIDIAKPKDKSAGAKSSDKSSLASSSTTSTLKTASSASKSDESIPDADKKGRKQAPGKDMDYKQEKLLVVETLPREEAERRARDASTHPRTSLVTKESFEKLVSKVNVLKQRFSQVGMDNAHLMDDLREAGLSMADARAALNLSARLEIAERTLDALLKTFFELAAEKGFDPNQLMKDIMEAPDMLVALKDATERLAKQAPQTSATGKQQPKPTASAATQTAGAATQPGQAQETRGVETAPQPGGGLKQPGIATQQPQGTGVQQSPGRGQQAQEIAPQQVQQQGAGVAVQQQPGVVAQSGAAVTQPIGAAQKPGAVMQTPGGTAPQSEARAKSPGAAAPQPGGGLQKPGVAVPPPSAGTQPSGEGLQRGTTAAQQPMGGVQETGAGQPGKTAKQPGGPTVVHGGVGSQKPGTAVQQPGGVAQHPGGAVQHPGGAGQHAGVAGQHLGGAGQHAGVVGQHPGGAGQHVGIVGQHPGAAGQHHGGVGKHPATPMTEEDLLASVAPLLVDEFGQPMSESTMLSALKTPEPMKQTQSKPGKLMLEYSVPMLDFDKKSVTKSDRSDPRSLSVTASTALPLPSDCMTYADLDEALNDLQKWFFQKLNNISTNTYNKAREVIKIVHETQLKIDIAIKIQHNMPKLENIIKQYSDRVNRLDAHLTCLMTEYQDSIQTMQHSLELGLDNMMEALANLGSDTTAIDELNVHFNWLSRDFEQTLSRQRQLGDLMNDFHYELKAISNALRSMRDNKADRTEVDEALRDKVGLHALNGFVNRLQFDAVRGDYEKRLEIIVNKFYNQETSWQKEIEDVHKHLSEKANHIHITRLRDDIDSNLAKLQEKVDFIADIVGPRSTKRNLGKFVTRDEHCLACSSLPPLKLEKLDELMARPKTIGAESDADDMSHPRGYGDGYCIPGLPIPHPIDSRSLFCNKICGAPERAGRVPHDLNVTNLGPTTSAATIYGTNGKPFLVDMKPCLPCNMPKKLKKITLDKPVVECRPRDEVNDTVSHILESLARRLDAFPANSKQRIKTQENAFFTPAPSKEYD